MFYQPRLNQNTQLFQQQQKQKLAAQQQMQQANPLQQRGTVSTSQTSGQQDGQNNLMSDAGGLAGLYKAGKGGSELLGDASTLYGRMTMPSGITEGSVLAGSGAESISGASNFLSGGASAAFPQGIAEGTGAADFLGGASSAAGADLLGSSAAATPYLDAAATSGAGLLGAGGEAAATGVAAEGAGLGLASVAGPVALGAAGVYGLGKMFKWW